MKSTLLRTLIFSVPLLLLSWYSYSENFRVRKVHFVSLEENTSFEKTVTVGINDSICVQLPEKKEFIEGIELKVQIPSSVSSWNDCVAFSLYDSVMPVPKENLIDYSGTRIFLQPLPSKVYWIAKIPMYEKTSIKDSVYTTRINVIPNFENGFAFVRFLPVMKGVPEETLNANLAVTIKPCLKNLGALKLLLDKSSENIDTLLDILIDDKLVSSQFDKDEFYTKLEPGVHNVSVQSQSYRSETRSIVIEQAKETDVQLKLKSLTPRLTISAPDNVEILFDNRKISEIGKEFEITEGEHTVQFMLGSYTVIRSIVAEKGKSYSANLNVDLQILEE